MARRKPVPKIEVEESVDLNETQPPTCYNQKCSFCRKDLCGDWFESCEEGRDDHAG